jgi:hypothetical protein
LAAGSRSASNRAPRNTVTNALSRPVSDCTTCAFAPAPARMSTPAPLLSRTWAPPSFVARSRAHGRPTPDYYNVLFEDPDGIRLEINHVPGAGIFADGTAFNPSEGYT